jgi:protoheme IX farnesyltransferase
VSLAVPRADVRRIVLAYLELTKPRIVFLVLLTGVPALLLAARGWPDARTALGAILGTALAAASAAAFNHYFDRDIDGLMARTKNRPLPAGTLRPSHALGFALVLAALALAVLTAWTNWLAALVGMLSIVYYALLYTVWLKRATPQNIVIGGAAGATAPLIAWAAVTGSIGLPAVLLAAIVFFWTPPHFWSLALYRREDYERAKIPMLPVTHGEDETRRQIMLYTLCLVPVTLAPAAIGVAGPLYWVPAAALGLCFLWFAWRLLVTAETGRAVRLFRFSIAYLFLLFVALGVDAMISGVRAPRVARGATPAAAAATVTKPPHGAPITIELSSHTMGKLAVRGTPLVPRVIVRRGEVTQVSYRFVNPSKHAIEFQAVHRVTPAMADTMFHKQLCFCFSRQRIMPGEVKTMPVRFVVDRALSDSVRALALDYALYELPPVTAPR